MLFNPQIYTARYEKKICFPNNHQCSVYEGVTYSEIHVRECQKSTNSENAD